MYTRGCVVILLQSRSMRRLRKLGALMLAAIVLATATGWAFSETAHQFTHAAAGTDSPLPSEQDKAPGHGCSNHLNAHLFAPLESPRTAAGPVRAVRAATSVREPHVPSVTNGLFRPPRVLVQA